MTIQEAVTAYREGGRIAIVKVNKAAKHYRVHPAAVEAQLRIWQR